ncbi:hypothetical protein [Pseudomonas alloputida]|jgi:uncharacterized protein (DUF1778 family)|uniref:hypothetical protein n=1 Tax=Pseudomonas alloputida TaxID=1940621 RepID=UPI0039178615
MNLPSAEHVIVLSPDGQRRLVEALRSPSEPSVALVRAARSHTTLVKQELRNIEGPESGSTRE